MVLVWPWTSVVISFGVSQGSDVQPQRFFLWALGWIISALHVVRRAFPGAAQWHLHNSRTGRIKTWVIIIRGGEMRLYKNNTQEKSRRHEKKGWKWKNNKKKKKMFMFIFTHVVCYSFTNSLHRCIVGAFYGCVENRIGFISEDMLEFWGILQTALNSKNISRIF